MYIIIGLGNYGSKYEMTRHNMGFLVVDKIASQYGIEINSKKHNALVGKGIIEGHKVMLMKPTTYMNLSGNALANALSFYKESIQNVIVIYDDVNLVTGNIRIRERGSAGGHNGIKHIISVIGTNEFKRVRVGVGLKPPFYDLADYVLQNFSRSDMEQVAEGVKKGSDAVVEILNFGMAKAMNKFNVKEKL